LNKEIDISNLLNYKDETNKYLRGVSFYKNLDDSNLSRLEKDEITNSLTYTISLYLSIKDQIQTKLSNKSNKANSLLGNKNNLKNSITNSYSNHLSIEHNFEQNFLSEEFNSATKIYSLHLASSIVFNKYYSNEKNIFDKFNPSLLSIINKKYHTTQEGENRLVCSNLLNLFSSNYFNKETNSYSVKYFLNEIISTTDSLIQSNLDSKPFKELLEFKVKNFDKIVQRKITEHNFNSTNRNKNDLLNNKTNDGNYYFLKLEKPKETFDDIGGLEEQKLLIDRYLQAIKFPEIYRMNDARSSSSILFYGPPGTGKSMIARAMANELKYNFAKVKIPDIISKYFGDSEKLIQSLFHEAKNNGKLVLFFDEVDGIARTRNSSDSEGSHRILTTLLDNLEDISSYNNVIPIFATNKYNSIDSAFKRAGRISHIVKIPLPDELTREKIFRKKIETSIKNSFDHNGDGIFNNFSDLNYKEFVKYSEKFNGADINEIIERIKVEKAYNQTKTKKSQLISSKQLVDLIKSYERKNDIEDF
jgi:ATP-dependent 26S proteasome regulatory subunit